jgi:glycosyltransferase involved in cell wall biosynthesis
MPAPVILSDGRWRGSHGIGRFAREVLRRLPEHTQLERGPRPLSAADPLWLACQVAIRRPGAFFSPGFNPPLLCPVPFVFTIHDLIQIQMPGVATPAKRLYYDAVIRPACRRAYRVLTVSEWSRAQIVRWAGIPGDRVVNVGNGVDAPFCPDGPRYDPGFPYILYVGNSRPHKNLDRLLRAFRDLDCPGLRLILAGAVKPEIGLRLDQLEIRERTCTLTDVSDEQLAVLYRGALLLVLPSLIEGFGLPALEAMACGTPVVASRATALPEVVGDAACLIDPLNVLDIRRAIEGVLSDPERRAAMRDQGIARARRFSWDRVAASVRSVLDDASGIPDGSLRSSI